MGNDIKSYPKNPPVRLNKKDYHELRVAACRRAMYHCEVCYRWTPIDEGHLDHYPKTRGAGAGDTLEETRWICYRCHNKRHTKGR